MDADEFPVVDTLPRIFGSQSTADAPTRQLTVAARGSDTRPLLAEEYRAHVAMGGHSAWIARVGYGFAGVLLALLLHIIGYLPMTWLYHTFTSLTSDSSYQQDGPSYTWVYYIPALFIVLLAVGVWSKSRALAAGLLLTVLLLALLGIGHGERYYLDYDLAVPPPIITPTGR